MSTPNFRAGLAGGRGPCRGRGKQRRREAKPGGRKPAGVLYGALLEASNPSAIFDVDFQMNHPFKQCPLWSVRHKPQHKE